LGGGILAGDYYFLNNAAGWRIKPDEVDHVLTINGNLYGEDAGTAIFQPTTGDYNVQIIQALSSLTQTVAGTSALDEIIEDGQTLRQILRGMAGVLLGKVSGAGTATETFRDLADTKDRVVSTVDSSGNRIAVVTDLT
jgi:hypothetical protein